MIVTIRVEYKGGDGMAKKPAGKKGKKQKPKKDMNPKVTGKKGK